MEHNELELEPLVEKQVQKGWKQEIRDNYQDMVDKCDVIGHEQAGSLMVAVQLQILNHNLQTLIWIVAAGFRGEKLPKDEEIDVLEHEEWIA